MRGQLANPFHPDFMINSTSEHKGLPPLKRILVLGNGGRENSLAWALANCKGIERVWVTPGNGGTEEINTCKRLEIEHPESKHSDKSGF